MAVEDKMLTGSREFGRGDDIRPVGLGRDPFEGQISAFKERRDEISGLHRIAGRIGVLVPQKVLQETDQQLTVLVDPLE
jgi:hypothetical protein